MWSPDRMEATAAMIKDTMTPGPAISLATSPDTTYIPVPTQLPTPSETRSKVVRTRANLVLLSLSNMDSTGLVRSTRDPNAPHWTRLGSNLDRKRLMVEKSEKKKEREGLNRTAWC